MDKYDVVVVGAGPNGLAASIALARAGLETLVVEGADTVGGGTRTCALTLAGFSHDVCSSVHPLGLASPFFASLGLQDYGLSWIQPHAPLAHMLEDGRAVTLGRSIDATAEQLGTDAKAYRRIFSPLAKSFERLTPMLLAPLRPPADPLLLARFGLSALQSMAGFSERHFSDAAAPALLAGMAAHAMLPLDELATASFGLVLGAAGHAVGWPLARGGSSAISAALVACLRRFGGEVLVNRPIRSRADLPPARAYVFDVTPRQLRQVIRSAH